MKGKWLVAGALILAEIALCGGIMASLWAGVASISNATGDWRLQLGEFGSLNTSVTADEEQRLEVTEPVTLNVNKGEDEAFGNVTVTGGSEGEVVLLAHKIGWGADEATAQQALDDLKVIVTQTGNTISINVQRPDTNIVFGTKNRSRVDFTIMVPAETTVNAVTDFGDVTVSDVKGDIELDTNLGAISVTSVTADEIAASTSFGEVNFEDVTAGNITAKSSSGEVTLSRVNASGTISLNTDFGGISFDTGEAESLDASTNSGDVKLTGIVIQEALGADTDFGSVTITGVSAASYDVNSNSGALSVDGANGSITAHTDYGDVTVTNAQAATLDLSTNTGAVEFSGSLAGGPHKLQSDFGNIRLELPAESALSVELKTDFGRIKSDLPITLTGEQDSNHWTGDINGGGETLTAETNSGGITIETYNP